MIATGEYGRRELGAYNTPAPLSDAIVDWAVRQAHETVLEPSFGTCSFLASAQARLRRLGATQPEECLFGCEIVPEVGRESLRAALGIEPSPERFALRDFLSVSPAELSGAPFDVVVGNPPYVSHHNMSDQQLQSVRRIRIGGGERLGGRASLWAYFVIHGLSFLRTGGRCAWILPRSFLFADYAEPVRSRLARGFERCAAIDVAENYFKSEGATEGSVVFVGDGWGRGGPATMGRAIVEDADELAAVLSTLVEDARPGADVGECAWNGRVDSELEWFRELGAEVGVIPLGDLARVSIGTVTGANHRFILTESDRRAHGLRETYLTRVVSSSRHVSGLQWAQKDWLAAKAQDLPVWMITTSSGSHSLRRRGSSLRRYLALVPREQRRSNRTFSKRTPWHEVQAVEPPDAILSYMTAASPRLIKNACGAVPTNSVHAVYFKKQSVDLVSAAAVGFVSSVGQLSAELTGRSMSGGLLKHEPSDARRISVPVLVDGGRLGDAFRRIDALLRRGKMEEARRLADDYCLGSLPERRRKELVKRIDAELQMLRYRRRRQPRAPYE